MGSHSAERQPRNVNGSPSPKPDVQRFALLGWGLFITVVSTAAMLLMDVPAGAVFLIAGVSFSAFLLPWVFIQLHDRGTDRLAANPPARRTTL